MKNIILYRNFRKYRFAVILSVTVLLNFASYGLRIYAKEDDRKSAHGLSIINNPVNGKMFLIWADNYGGDSEKEAWEHDIYYKELTENISEEDINSAKKLLIKANEAQEPASASVSGDGKIIITFEDGDNAGDSELAQRYAVYDENMNVIKEYPCTIALGGHSGHAASTDNRHVVFWSEGWVDGGGVDNLGSGDDVWITALTTDGDILSTKKIAVGEKTRDWWPMVAASKKKVLLLWQRFIKDEKYASLCTAVYDPVKNDFVGKNGKKTGYTKPHIIKGTKTSYYNYNAVWSEVLDVFVVNYTDSAGTGKILLIDENGKIKKTIGKNAELPSFVREALPAYIAGNRKVKLIYPSSKNEYFMITIKKIKVKGKENFKIKISKEKKLAEWGYRGIVGVGIEKGKRFFIYLDKNRVRIKEVYFDKNKA